MRNEWIALAGLPGSATNFGESELDTPHLTLVLEAIFADGLEFGVPTTNNSESDKIQSTWPESKLWTSGREIRCSTYKRADSNGRRGTL